MIQKIVQIKSQKYPYSNEVEKMDNYILPFDFVGNRIFYVDVAKHHKPMNVNVKSNFGTNGVSGSL